MLTSSSTDASALAIRPPIDPTTDDDPPHAHPHPERRALVGFAAQRDYPRPRLLSAYARSRFDRAARRLQINGGGKGTLGISRPSRGPNAGSATHVAMRDRLVTCPESPCK